MFFGSERELNSLNRLYVSDKFEFGLLTSIPIIKDGEGALTKGQENPKAKENAPICPCLIKPF